MDKGSILISQGQVLSFMAFHLIRFWPEPIPPNLENILHSWKKITERDFDDFDTQEIKNAELSSYLVTTLAANPKYREICKNENFKEKSFIKAVCESIREEIKELKEQ